MRRHRFDPFAFLFGAIFLTIGLSIATGASGVDVLRQFRSWPTAVIVIGFVLVAWALTRVLRPAVEVEDAPGPPLDVAEVDTDTAELDEGEPPV